jgi:tRNA A-37 threonylcarbamoyl transferase component Bud32
MDAKARRDKVSAHVLKQLLEAFREMSKKLKVKVLARFEAERDVWQEVLEGVREIKAGRGKPTKVKQPSHAESVRLKRGFVENRLDRRTSES